MRAVGLFRPVQAVRPSLLQQRGSQMMWMASRGYTVPREEATTRVTSVVKAFDKVCAADRPLVPACVVFLLSFPGFEPLLILFSDLVAVLMLYRPNLTKGC